MSAPTAQQPRKSPRPAPGPRRDYHFPRFVRRRLENGLELIVAPVTKLPLVTVAVVIDAGAVCDSAGREGVARLGAKLMLEGTDKYDGAELTERFERLGASIDAEADWDEAALTMTVTSDRLPAAFDLLGEVLRSPAFPQREVDRLKAEREAELLQLRAEPRGLADELFTQFLYTPSSRYARPDGGDEASVAGLERSHFRAFYESRYAPGATTVIVVGDVTADRAEELARSTLGGWSGSKPQKIAADASPSRLGRAVHIVAKADAPQSELRIGHIGIPRNHPDFFAVNVMNAILGGLFNSRINLNLREAHGYTYGAFSVFDWRRQAGPFLVQTAVRSDITDAAAREVLIEIDRIRADRVGEDELSLATSYLDGVFPIRFETTAAIAAALSILVVHGLPEDYYDRYRERVRAVTRDQILEAARQHLHPEALQLVAVGDPSVIRERLTTLEFGPVSLYDATGQRIE
ncbi:MAG TPA: pitrilysin family protein [Gemmatimonadaceae bacterium]|jgi:zinc protease|nr:pitrilysin family protein [Gemmatimonadaceae bacterium]